MEMEVKAEVWRKPNGNTAIMANCPICNYQNYLVVDETIAFPVEPDICKHFVEIIYDGRGISLKFEEVKSEDE